MSPFTGRTHDRWRFSQAKSTRSHFICLSFPISHCLSFSHWLFSSCSRVIAHSICSYLALSSPSGSTSLLLSRRHSLLFLVPRASIIHIFAWTFWVERYQQDLSGSSHYTWASARDTHSPAWGCMHMQTHTRLKCKWGCAHSRCDARERRQVLMSRFSPRMDAVTKMFKSGNDDFTKLRTVSTLQQMISVQTTS